MYFYQITSSIVFQLLFAFYTQILLVPSSVRCQNSCDPNSGGSESTSTEIYPTSTTTSSTFYCPATIRPSPPPSYPSSCPTQPPPPPPSTNGSSPTEPPPANGTSEPTKPPPANGTSEPTKPPPANGTSEPTESPPANGTSSPTEPPSSTNNSYYNNCALHIFYETKCPFSQEFLIKQVAPNYMKYWNCCDLIVYPYGNQKNASDKTTCQHGEEECELNVNSQCGIAHAPDKETGYKFVLCVENTTRENPDNSVADTVSQCSNSCNLDYETLTTCANGAEGDTLNHKYGDITEGLDPGLPGTPNCRFYKDMEYDENLNAIVQSDYGKGICTMNPFCPPCSGNYEY